MTVWRRSRAVSDFWMNDPRLADGARYKARLMAPTFAVAAAVFAVVSQGGIAALTFAVAIEGFTARYGASRSAHAWHDRPASRRMGSPGGPFVGCTGGPLP